VLGEAGLDPDASPRATTEITIDDARDAAGPLLDQQPTAVFCDDDIIAGGLYLAARERGLRIPGDLSVVGFDDMDFARVLDPALTTVALDAELLGATAFELLEEHMAGGRPRRPIVLPAELVVRGSTAPPRG
jgi:DNA-binding LacI/PurR family transcriptional regulator